MSKADRHRYCENVHINDKGYKSNSEIAGLKQE